MMRVQDDMDLSFLDGETSDKAIDELVQELSSIHTLFMCNDDVDVRVITVNTQQELETRISELFPEGRDTMQIVVHNGHESRFVCGYFRLILSGYGTKTPINYKFETFMRAANVTNIMARCKAAMVIGLEPVENVPLSVPAYFRLTSLEALAFMGDLDFACLQTIRGARSSEDIIDIVGNVPLPSVLPDEIHWQIFKYLRHPCATLIHNEMER